MKRLVIAAALTVASLAPAHAIGEPLSEAQAIMNLQNQLAFEGIMNRRAIQELQQQQFPYMGTNCRLIETNPQNHAYVRAGVYSWNTLIELRNRCLAGGGYYQ